MNLKVNGNPIGTGFLGALAVGFIIGYLIMLLKKIHIAKNFEGIVNLMV